MPGTAVGWMARLPPEARGRPLTQLVLPMTHDSAAYATNLGVPLADPERERLRRLAALPPVASILRGWTLTQHATIGEQLRMGVRALDVRVARLAGEYHCAHATALVPFRTVLDDVERFCRAEGNEQEVVLLVLRADHPNRATLAADGEPERLWAWIADHRLAGHLHAPIAPGAVPSHASIVASGRRVLLLCGEDLRPPATSVPPTSDAGALLRSVTDWRVPTLAGRRAEVAQAFSDFSAGVRARDPHHFLIWGEIVTPTTRDVAAGAVVLVAKALLGGAVFAAVAATLLRRRELAGVSAALALLGVGGVAAAGGWGVPTRTEHFSARSAGVVASKLAKDPSRAAFVSLLALDHASPATVHPVVAANFGTEASPLFFD
jgi:hypothetical protein